MLPKTTALLLVDAQLGWQDPVWGERNNPGAEAKLADLVAAFRRSGLAVVHCQQDSRDPNSPLFPGEPGHAFLPGSAPIAGEPVLRRHAHCAFVGTGLEGLLRDQGIDRLVIAGFTTSRCVSSTARLSCDLGFKTVVVQDATATFALEGLDGAKLSADQLHAAELAELHGAFAVVLPTEAILQLL